MLLEALIGLLIFSIGILAVIGLQALSIKAVADAKYRSDAAMLANELMGSVWGGSKSLGALQTAYNSPSGTYFTNTWLPAVQNELPGVTPSSNAPSVAVTQVVASGLNVIQVAVTVRWQAPGQSAHSYSTLTQLNCTVTDSVGTACSY